MGTSNIVDGGELWRMSQLLPATPTSTATNTPTSTPTFTATNTPTSIPTVVTSFLSQAAYDGWVLESAENSGRGGTLNNEGSVLAVGDNAANRQYRTILSFNTASLPNNAVILSVRIRVKKAGLAGTDPFITHGNLRADIGSPRFGTQTALQISDFQATASMVRVGRFTSPASAGWYTANLSSTAITKINKAGITQFRLRFSMDDNNDFGADYLKFYSGGARITSRPKLVIEYYVP
jgi:hypothetical protein